MNRLPLYGTVIVLASCGVIVWHLLILARLHSMLSDGQILLIAALVNLVPFTALLCGLLIGTYEHFLSSSPDNVFRMAPGEWTLQFRITAVLLMIVEGLGCWIGVKASRENTFSARHNCRQSRPPIGVNRDAYK